MTPTQLINSLFPTDELKRLLAELADGEELNDIENKATVRLNGLFQGNYPKT